MIKQAVFMAPMRECVKCKEMKPLSEFSRNRYIEGGLQVKCKVCERKDEIAWRTHTKEAE